MKKLQILSFLCFVTFLSCEEKNNDILLDAGGELGAIMEPVSNVTYLGGISTGVDVALRPFVNEGVTLSSINVTKTLRTTAGNSDPVTYEVSGESFAQTTSELFADVPVGGAVQTNSTLTPGDTWLLSYSMTLSDGRTMSIGAETVITFLCAPYPGVWTIDMHDSYGDGWQTNDGNGGDGIQVTLNDGTVLEVGMCSPYGAAAGTFLGDGDCTGPASTSFFNATETITIPVGTQNAEWYFPGDRYGEISFEIYGPDGSLVYTGEAGDAEGIMSVILCAP
jgi:hypothetical protein